MELLHGEVTLDRLLPYRGCSGCVGNRGMGEWARLVLGFSDEGWLSLVSVDDVIV